MGFLMTWLIYDYQSAIQLACTYGQSDKDLCSSLSRQKNISSLNMSRVVRKPAFCICENKDADQLRGNREADQRLCFRFTDSTIPLLPTYKISSL